MRHRLIETTYYASGALAFGKKKLRYNFTIALTIHIYVITRIILEEVRSNDPTSQLTAPYTKRVGNLVCKFGAKLCDKKTEH